MGCTPSSSVCQYHPTDNLDLRQLDKVIKNKNVLERLRLLGPDDQYVDTDFQGLSALYLDEAEHAFANKIIQWYRTTELIENPELFVDGISRLDIVQGDLGDCWFLCACAAVTLKPEIWTKVIPADNKLFNHRGLYHFQFWRFGEWVDVYIDDLLPTRNGDLIYAQATDSKEVWPQLIEKAYAKVNGCYEALQSGKASEGLLDLTGGLTEVYYPPNMRGPELFDVLRQSLRNGAFLACNTDSEHDGSRGLITGHAYSITMATKLPTSEGVHNLLRIFNPWGGTEWTGDWSDQSEKWKLVPAEVKKSLSLKQELDGEFWMSYSDFCQHFARVYICTLGPDFDMDGIVDKSKMYSFHGAWVPGLCSGGCSDNLGKYATNPQYRFSISTADNPERNEWEEDEIQVASQKCFLIVSLMQKFERVYKKKDPLLTEQYINFRLYQVENFRTHRLDKRFFLDNSSVEPVLGEVDYTNTREVTCRFLLNPGEYVLVPSSFDPDIYAAFLLRLYAWTQNFECKQLL